jgi:hypothetical protein
MSGYDKRDGKAGDAARQKQVLNWQTWQPLWHKKANRRLIFRSQMGGLRSKLLLMKTLAGQWLKHKSA